KNAANDGIRVATATGITTITSGSTDANGASGVHVEDGQVVIDGCQVVNSGNDGVFLEPAAVGTVNQAIVLSATGLRAHDNGASGVHVARGGGTAYGAVTLSASEVYVNAGAGVAV